MPKVATEGERGRVVTVFTIMRDGKVVDVRVVAGSGTAALDSAAMASIQNASIPILPPIFKGDRLTLQLTFLYNLPPGQ
jgi:TonB family protein